MSFAEALKHTLEFEGGYANDPADRGGETFRGISRKNWPRWSGWDLIDQVKRKGADKNFINLTFSQDAEMEALVAKFYHDNFWVPFERLELPPRVTAKLFDTAVNMGVGQATKFLQRAVGTNADGVAGPKTRIAIDEYWTEHGESGESALLANIVDAQGNFYRNIVKRNPSQAKFINGWLRRADWVPAESE